MKYVKKRTICVLLSVAVILAFMPLIPGFNGKAFAGYDTTAPKINSVTFNKTSVTKPGTFSVTIDFTEEGTGLCQIYLHFMSSNGSKDLTACSSNVYTVNGDGDGFEYKSPKFTGKITLTFAVSSNYPASDLRLGELQVYDKNGNYADYFNGWEDTEENGVHFIEDFYSGNRCTISNNNKIDVLNEFDVAFQTFINNTSIVSKLKAMDDGEAAMINYDRSNHIASKSIFDAIKGTNKNVVFSNDGVQWIVNGKAITGTTKDIDLQTSFDKVDGSAFGVDGKIIVLNFADNGTLPGKMVYRFKSNYILGSNQYLYYDKGKQLSYESNQVTGYQDGNEKWTEIPITHNSSFYISKGKIANLKTFSYKKGYYSITKVGKEVTYKGPANKIIKSVNIPSKVIIGKKTYKVTSIAKNAFKGNTKVKTVTIGKNVKKINRMAFNKSKVKKLVVKSKMLKKPSTVKGAFQGSKVKKVTVKYGYVGKKNVKKSFTKRNLKAKSIILKK